MEQRVHHRLQPRLHHRLRDPGSRPGGEVGDGAVLDFAVLAERFTEEDGWGRAAIGDLRHVHNCIISEIGMHNNRYKNTYMTTSVNRITSNPLGFNYFRSNAWGKIRPKFARKLL